MTINVRGQLLDLSAPKVMGILNLTPDSFYDGGKLTTGNEVLAHAEKMLHEGADIVDIGGMSSRPGAEIISEEEELKRVLPHVQNIISKFPKFIYKLWLPNHFVSFFTHCLW